MPLACLVTVVLGFKSRWRRWVGFFLPIAAAVIFIFTQLAISSGDAFSEIVPVNTDDHEALALMTRNWIGLFTVSSLILAFFDRWQAKDDGPDWLSIAVPAMVAVTILSSVAATVWMVRTGDEGARLVWENVLFTQPRG